MYKNKKSTKKYSVQRDNNKINNTEEATLKKSVKTDIENGSPQHSCDSRVYGHSTPIRKIDNVIDLEDSPELDYRCSPILMPCTQDGGNEIAWDWQNSVKSSNDKTTSLNNLIETPKRTKQLQKKRNSNSPLLQKPLKRKQVKMENIENIEKLAAELKALSEKMKSIQQNYTSNIIENDTKCGTDSILTIELDIDNDNDDDKRNSNNNDTNYEDLFNDSIDDSMVKCSQEIEEKLNLCRGRKNNTKELSKICEKRELCSTFEKESCCQKSNTSTDCSKSSGISKTSSTNISGHLKTYSSNSSKTHSTLNISGSISKLINNNITNVSHEKQTLQEKDLLNFPDDSFDDCLATCVEDDKLVSKLSEYDFSPSNLGLNTRQLKKTVKHVISNTTNGKKIPNKFLSKPIVYNESNKLITDDLLEEVETITDKNIIQKSFPSKSALDNRKFFKTKSLSDQYFHQSRSVKSEKGSQSNLVNSSVSTLFPIVNGRNPYTSSNFPSINGMENTHNRLNEKDGGNCIVKYKSTSNLSSVKEVKESQPVQCTAEEIERKRLEAKMKLEAKRKLQQTNTRKTDIPSEVPVKKCVKR